MTNARLQAVISNRVEPSTSLDDFPTPPWAVRALCHYILPDITNMSLNLQSVWEPSCNRGFMVKGLEDYFIDIRKTDIHDYGYSEQQAVVDFINPDILIKTDFDKVDWVITNPPFNRAADFIQQALSLTHTGCAFFVRTCFLEGINRFYTLFNPHPPIIVAPFVERVPIVKGRYDPKARTKTSYCWLVWLHESFPGIKRSTELKWIPPCRKRFEKSTDARFDL